MRGRSKLRRSAVGLSLVELMVGVAVGLMVVAGASFVAVNQLSDNRRLLLETQVQQDLRATADMVARDLRRAGYWGGSESGAWKGDDPAVAVNPYRAISPDVAGSAVEQIDFSYSSAANSDEEDNDLDDEREQFGFVLDGGVVKMKVGGVWQSLTDSNVLEVTRFDISSQPQVVQQACFKECVGGGTACWPSQTVRRYVVLIEGRARSDLNVRRSVRESVRVRNDTVGGTCPV